METLQVQVDGNENLNINDLVTLQEQGFSVLRSAHVGNLSPYNLTLADAGIPMLLVDHNVTGVDKNYFPEQVLTQTSETVVADAGRLSCRALATNGQFLDELHIDGIRTALPQATVFSNSEYLRRNETVAGEITALAVQNFPAGFTRLALPDGSTQENANAAELVARLGVLQLTDDVRAEKSAVLLPNMVDIMANFVIEALNSEREVQYHISGPDMVRYIGTLAQDLQKFYEIIKRDASFGARLPQNLVVQVVPGADARFATTSQRSQELTDLFTQLDESDVALAALAARRKTFFTTANSLTAEARAGFSKLAEQQKSAIERAVVERAESVTGLFTESRQPGFITQYDVVQEGGLAVPQQNMTLSFSELAAVHKRLLSLRKRRRP